MCRCVSDFAELAALLVCKIMERLWYDIETSMGVHVHLCIASSSLHPKKAQFIAACHGRFLTKPNRAPESAEHENNEKIPSKVSNDIVVVVVCLGLCFDE